MSDTPDDLDPKDPNLEPQDPPADPQDPPKDPEPKKDRYKEDLLKQKAENRKLQDELAAARKEKEDSRIAAMHEKEQYKELAEEYRQKLDDAEEKQRRLNEAVVLREKYTAVKEQALQMGIRKEALVDLDLLNMDGLEIETTSTGRVIVKDPKGFVEDLKITKPHWFGRRSTKLNGNQPEVIDDGGKVTIQMIQKAEREAKKSGDNSQYLSLVKRYKQQ